MQWSYSYQEEQNIVFFMKKALKSKKIINFAPNY